MTLLIRCLLLTIAVFAGAEALSQEPLPDVQVRSLDGRTVQLEDFVKDGRITILSFWATWCSPCKKELDAIADVYEDWQSAYDVELIAISVDNARALARVKPMVAEKGWPYMILADPNQALMRALHFQSVPHTILLNQEREIIYSHSGYLPGDEQALEEEIQALVN
ncbi:MAG: TlpA family protein disulfide reductase [Saprospiraceae bacterium]|nr:TlpA family protein disulfide reductase [Saprospiraceae bacterium]